MAMRAAQQWLAIVMNLYMAKVVDSKLMTA
jgi:hypothetical protein